MPGLAQKGTKSEVKLIRTAVCTAYLLQIKHKIVFKKNQVSELALYNV